MTYEKRGSMWLRWCGLLRHLCLTVNYAMLQDTMVCQIRVNRGQMIRDHTLPLLKEHELSEAEAGTVNRVPVDPLIGQLLHECPHDQALLLHGLGTSASTMGMPGIAWTISARDLGLSSSSETRRARAAAVLEGRQERRAPLPAPPVRREDTPSDAAAWSKPDGDRRRQDQFHAGSRQQRRTVRSLAVTAARPDRVSPALVDNSSSRP